MSRRVLNLGIAVGIFVLVVVGSQLLPPADSSGAPSARPAPTSSPPPAVVPTPSVVSQPSPAGRVGVTGVSATEPQTDARTYALTVSELRGLPPNASPGTELELWVAWDPPVTKEPRFQLLVRRVILEKIVPGVTAEAPATALLRIKKSEVPDVLYGDRYGSFSVAVLPDAA